MKCHPSRTRIIAAPATGSVSNAASTTGAVSGASTGLRGRVVDRVRASADSTQYVVEIGEGLSWQCTGALKDELDIGAAVVLDLSPEHLHLFKP